jgi:hypothetical protein
VTASTRGPRDFGDLMERVIDILVGNFDKHGDVNGQHHRLDAQDHRPLDHPSPIASDSTPTRALKP